MDPWNIIDIVQLTLSYILLITWLVYNTDSFLLGYTDDPESYTDEEILRGMTDIQFVYRFYRRLAALNALFMALRFLKYAGKMKRVALIIASIRRAKNEMIAFFTYLAAFLLAFSVFAYIGYGRYFWEFHIINEAVLSCMEIFFADFHILKPMYHVDKRFGVIFTVFYTFLMILILGNVFINIIMTNYEEVIDNWRAEKAKAQKR